MKLTISGNKGYVSRLSSHLKKEHPSTRKRMRVSNSKRSKSTKRK